MSVAALGASAALAVGKELVKHAQFACEVIIENRTPFCLIHKEYYAAHGDINPSGLLPAIPPWCEINDAAYPADDHASFPQVVGVYGTPIAPAVVMQWKFVGQDLYLLVFAYLGGIGQDNGGYFQLTTKPVEDLQKWWGAVEKNKTWFYHGDFQNLATTIGGVHVSGSLDNNNPAEFRIALEIPRTA